MDQGTWILISLLMIIVIIILMSVIVDYQKKYVKLQYELIDERYAKNNALTEHGITLEKLNKNVDAMIASHKQQIAAKNEIIEHYQSQQTKH